MNSFAVPPGHQREQALVEMLGEVELASKELQATLPFVNDPALRPHVEALASGAATVMTAYQPGAGRGSNVADDLASLLSAARALRVPAQDPDLGRTNTLRSLRSAKGLIVAALEDALDAAQALGLHAQQATLIRNLPAEVQRAGNEGVLRGIATRLDEVVERLDALQNAKMVPTDFAQQTGLLDFYVDAMRTEVGVAKMHLTVSDKTADFGALARAVELMSELTGDFVTTVRAWVGRVSDTVVRLAADIHKKVRRVAAGTRTAARLIVSKAQSRAAPAPERLDPPQDAPRGLLSASAERTLHHALSLANERQHEYSTLEHLLLSLTEDDDAIQVLLACGVDLDRLHREVLNYVDNELFNLVRTHGDEAKPAPSFQRVLQRAAIHVQSSDRVEVTGANLLVAMFAERESHAVYFLQEQDMTRFDAVNYISHGIAKAPGRSEQRVTVDLQPNISPAANYYAARAAYEQALSLFRQTGDVQGEAGCLKSLGEIALTRADYDTARAAYEQALSLFRQTGDVQGEAGCLKGLGDVARLAPPTR